MSNGPIGRVAPTQAQQGGTYSDAINRQVDLIQRQRAVNLQNRLAQDQKNREFRTEQLQNIYDFDVTALPPKYAAEIKEAQDKMASWLDPNSEVRYENKQQLISDISRLNNYYLAGKNQRLTSNEARTDYDNALIGGTSVAGAVMAGTETTRNNRQAAADAGGFGAYSVDGAPGSLSITGIQMEEGENGQYTFDEATGERLDILDSNFADGSGFFRLDLVAAAPYLSTATEGAMTDKRLDGTNSEAVAQIDYDVMNDAEKTRLQKEVYEEKTAGDNKAKPFEEWIKTADQAAIGRLGLDEASLVNAIAASYDKGLDARPGISQDPLFDPQKTTSGLTNLKEKITVNVEDEEFAGTVIAADYVRGENLEDLRDADGNIVIPIELAYLGANNAVTKRTIDPSNPAYQQFIQSMGESGINEMFDRAGYTITTGDNAGGDNQQGGDDPAPQDLETADLEQQRLDILEGTGDNEGMRSIEQRAENAKQEAIDSASEEVGFFGRMAGNESKSDIEARPITDFMSPAEKLAYNQAQKDLAAIDAQLGGEPNDTTQSADNQAPQNPAAQPIQTEAPEAAAAIENSNVEAPNPNTGEPVTVDASATEKQQAALAAFGGIIPLETQEDEIQESIQELFVNVAPSDSTWLWTGAQEDFESGKNSDPVPPWCAAWVADMILRANPDFDFSAVESPSYGQTEKQAGEVNRVRAQHYQKIGEPVSKTGDQYDAQVGDVVIKKVGTQFHVGFFAGYDEDGNVLILGGNQADSLNVTPYPADQIVSVRRIDVAAIDKEDVEKISATMNSSGKVT